MARKPIPPATNPVTLNEKALRQDMKAMDELAVIDAERQENQVAILAQFGDCLPFKKASSETHRGKPRSFMGSGSSYVVLI